MRYVIPPSHKQVEYVSALQRKLRITDRSLDLHCNERFGEPFSNLSRSQVSDLLDEMTGWEQAPASLQRANGQMDLIPPDDRGRLV